jgi:hypothetical protein
MSLNGFEAEWSVALIQDKIPTTIAWNANAATSNPECTLLLYFRLANPWEEKTRVMPGSAA